ncbi:MAG: glycosyltransferase family 4 protein [Euryarchaeota archaeon]|nr:glycosyltransferase family 4 protein [Euryarchaeota archaeon]
MLYYLEPEGVRFYDNSLRVCDVLHAHTFGPLALLLVLLHKACRRAVVIHAHTTPQDMKNSYVAASVLSGLFKYYLEVYYNLADVCIAPSTYTKELLLQTLRIKRRIEVLSNGIDLSSYNCGEQRAAKFRKQHALSDRPLILSVGFVFIRKGIADFVEAARKLPDYYFVWVGRLLPSPLLPHETKEILNNAPRNVLFTGRVDNVCDPLSAADVFVFPSYEENQGIAALEASACALPLVLRDLPVYTDYVHGSNCIKFTTNQEFTAAVDALVKDRAKAYTLGENAKKTAQKHDLRVISKELLHIYITA